MLRNVLCFSLIALLTPNAAHALELKNVRPMYGLPPLGAPRADAKCLPGDILFVSYDIEGLAFHKETGKANYMTSLEFIDAKGTQLFKRETPNEVVAQLGGTRMPGDLHVILGRNLAAGQYTVKLTVTDRIANESKSFTYPVELLPSAFGIVGVIAPAVGFPGQHYLAKFNLVDLGFDSKAKNVNATVGIRLLDDKNQQVSKEIVMQLPRDVPQGIDLQKENFVPIDFPVYLNRVGRFTIEVQAVDHVTKKKASLKLPLSVIDVGSLVGGGS